MIKLRTAMTLGAAFAVLAACGPSDSSNEATERAMENAAARHGVDADVELDSSGDVKSVVINNGVGGKVGANLELPADFPDDIFVPETWNILMTSPVPGQSQGFSMQALSSGSQQEIAAEIRENMTSNAWSETGTNAPVPHMLGIQFEKDARLASFNIVENGDTFMIQMSTMEKP